MIAMTAMVVRPAAVWQEQHWALQYEAMESLLLYSRSPKSGDIKQVLPRSLYNPGKIGCLLTHVCGHLPRAAADTCQTTQCFTV